MQITSIRVRNFRSISDLLLPSCGPFNVLIGKNNSGKSTILSAINGFFSTASSESLVSLSPTFGKRIDFHNAQYAHPIEVSVTFSLTDSERVALISSIVDEAPQMKNAVEGLPHPLRLTATLRIPPDQPRYSYISALLVDRDAESTEHNTPYTLLRMSDASASELAQRSIKSQTLIQQAQSLSAALSRIDQDDWERFRHELASERRPTRDSGGSPFRFFLRHAYQNETLTEDAIALLTSSIREETSYPEFRRSVESFIASQADERVSIEKEPLKAPLDTFSGQDAHIPKYVLRLVREIGSMRVHYLTDRRDPIGKAEAERLLNLKVRRGGNEELQNIQDIVSSLLGVNIDAFQGEAGANGQRTAELDVDDFLVEANGSGIREALRLILDVEFSQPAVVLVEEPEMHLHPGLETSMMRYLKRKSNECQVFLTTHSTNFLDTADMSNVYLVSKLRDTTLRMVNFEDAESQIPRELGIKLSSLFMFDRLVFVEGPSDESIIREWASKLGINLSQANVGFVQLGGSRNFLYFAAEATLSFLKKRGVAMWFLLDRDERDAIEVDRLTAQLGDRARVVVLQRRELENYLVCPRAIREFVLLKRKLSGGAAPRNQDITVDSVSNALNEAAEELRNLAIQKRVARVTNRPIYPQYNPDANAINDDSIVSSVSLTVDGAIEQLVSIKGRVTEILRDERQKVDGEWAARKLEIVPGDELLDFTCQKFGVRFQKERDGVRIANFMVEGNIAEEIQKIIHEIGCGDSSQSVP